MKMLNHVLFIQYEYGMQSARACSHNNDTTTSLKLSHICIHLQRYNIIAHPQHIKVLKHFVYIQYKRGMQSAVVCSLNHDTTPSFKLSYHNTFFQKFTATFTDYSDRVHPYAPHPQYMKVLILHIQYECVMQSVVVCSLDYARQHHSGSVIPDFSKNHLHWQRYNNVRVHPYVHPQHIKVLKYFCISNMDYMTNLYSDTYHSSVEELVRVSH